MLRQPVAHHLPEPLRSYGEAWERLESWLISHGVGVRHQEHKVFALHLTRLLPARAVGEQIRAGHPVLAHHTVGIVGWVLPHVAILDYFGLNDAVIAREPPRATGSEGRSMAHNRAPPEGYLECFRPNVFVDARLQLEVRPREAPLTEDEIRHCEATYRERARKGRS